MPRGIPLRKYIRREDELVLTRPVSIDGHVRSQRPVTNEHSLLFVPSNISQASRCSKVTVQNRMMKTGLLWRLLLARELIWKLNSHESIIGHCRSGAVGLMAYFGSIKGRGALSVHKQFKIWRKLPKLFMCNTAEGFAI
ncbi:hypothetical protein CDAR_622381 [Caerostris darwini]|uniref:Uncharacterized protein n=1 Tax=Caerostris darwini TaxID=1538125 RepID=A0AAV4W454_9ARAC|nr:hypothetical protein CDAR_622381 [Caerostris darwini]